MGTSACLSDVQESCVPFVGPATGSLGGYGKSHALAVLELVHDKLCQRRCPFALAGHGNTAYGAKEGTQGPEEPCVLHQKAGLSACCGVCQFTDDKVPVARVRSDTNNAFWIVGDCDVHRPSKILSSQAARLFIPKEPP